MSALEDAVEDLKKRFRREARDRRLSDGLRRSARAALGALCMAQVVGCGGAPFEAGIIDTDAGAEKDGARGPSDSYGDPPPVDASADVALPLPDAAPSCPHTDGFGDSFNDCATDPLALAYAACIAAGGNRDGGPIGAVPVTCVNESPCGDGPEYVELVADAGCREWIYSGDAAGSAYTSCGCPSGPSTAWH